MAQKVIYELPNLEEGNINRLNLCRLEKELLGEGQWVHPEKKFRIKVTQDRMASWIRKFNEMRACDLNIVVIYDSFKIAGWLQDLRLVGKSLIGDFQIECGEDAELFKNVMVAINPDLIDQVSRRWGEVIDHIHISSALGTEGDRIVSSEDGEKIEILRFVPISECQDTGMSIVRNLRRQVLKSLNRNILSGFGFTPIVIEGRVLNAQGDIEVIVKDGNWHCFKIRKSEREELEK